MTRGRRTALWRITLDHGEPSPLTRQLSDALRRAVLAGQLRAAVRLPSTRALALELGVSRNTVLDAYAQLVSEGYFEARTGSGTFVAALLPDDAVRHRARPGDGRTAARPRSARVSKRGTTIAATSTSISDGALRAFSPGIPAVDPPLFDAWTRVASRRRRRLSSDLLTYGDAAGYRPLREAIAAYLGPTRGVVCTADQVIITAGTQQALDLAVRLLVNPGESAWLEDPAYPGARGAFAAGGLTIVPAPVDEEGMRVDEARRRAPDARLAYVSPSHQYPLGATMSLTRRLGLLGWAEQADAWILEDDYDSEFRYGGRPLPALQGLDRAGRVLYLGTFSKVLFPALRLGYVIVPRSLVSLFENAASIVGHGVSSIEQAVLADFITEGHFSRHIRRMRRRYDERRGLFVTLIEERLSNVLTITGSAAGLHVAALLARGFDDREVSRRGAAAGLTLPPLSEYYLRKPRGSGLVLGYGHLERAAIHQGIDKLAAVFRTL